MVVSLSMLSRLFRVCVDEGVCTHICVSLRRVLCGSLARGCSFLCTTPYQRSRCVFKKGSAGVAVRFSGVLPA